MANKIRSKIYWLQLSKRWVLQSNFYCREMVSDEEVPEALLGCSLVEEQNRCIYGTNYMKDIFVKKTFRNLSQTELRSICSITFYQSHRPRECRSTEMFGYSIRTTETTRTLADLRCPLSCFASLNFEAATILWSPRVRTVRTLRNTTLPPISQLSLLVYELLPLAISLTD